MRWFPVSVLTASILHLVWALGLFLDPASRNATAIHALLLITSSTQLAGTILLLVALLAILGAFLDKVWVGLRVALILPQQCILIMSSIAASEAMMRQSFADGVLRPFWFITVDQAPIIVITAGYLVSLSRIILDEEGRPDGR